MLTEFGMLVFFTKLGQRISGQIFGLISFQSNRWLQLVLDGKFLQEYPVNTGVPQGSILGLTLLLYINDLPDDVSAILLSVLMIPLFTLIVIRHMICGNN